jgi:hypothetical protein
LLAPARGAGARLADRAFEREVSDVAARVRGSAEMRASATSSGFMATNAWRGRRPDLRAAIAASGRLAWAFAVAKA